MSHFLRQVAQVIHDYSTGPDGESHALGKGLAAVMCLVGLPLPYVMLHMHAAFGLAEAGVYFGALGAAVMALVWGTNPAEPPAATAPSTSIKTTIEEKS